MIHPWMSNDWKAAGGTREWFCTTSAEAFTAKDPVWKTLSEELCEIVGEAVYAELIRKL